MIMNKSKEMNMSKKRNMNDYSSQGILEVEKVLNESQTFQSIQDPVGQIDEAAELQKVLDMKYSDKNEDDIWKDDNISLLKFKIFEYY